MRTDARDGSDRRGGGRTAGALVALALAGLLVGAAAAGAGVTRAGQPAGGAPATGAAPPEASATRSASTALLPASTALPPASTALPPASATQSPAAGTASTAAAAPADACAPVSNGTPPPDPEEDRLGWERGCWANASLDVDQRDGLNEAELDAVVARAMARVEVVRRLEFVAPVRVEVISSREFAARVDREFVVSSEQQRLRKNVKWEALLVVGEDEDAVDVRRAAISGAGGYYSPTRERIVVVSPDGTAPKLSELTLAHELVHPLQVQHFDAADRFDLATFEQRRTTESLNAINSLLEGDAEFVRDRYARRCDAEWACLPSPPDGGQDGANAGMQFATAYPYLDGPTFVRGLYEEGGWEAVDAAYDDPPDSTAEVIYSDRYPGYEPPSVAFTDRSGPGWRVPTVDTGQPDYVSVGEPGLTSMMLYTDLDGNNDRSPVFTIRALLNDTASGVDRTDPYVFEENFYASGLAADRLYPYVTDRSSETGETGYVWKLVFESRDDGAEFVDGYTRMLEYHGARPVEGRKDTYRIPEDEPFGDAFYLNRTGSTVYVVNAPSVGELSAVRACAAPATGGGLLAALPFADEPTWVVATILALLVGVVGLSGRLVLALRRGSSDGAAGEG